MYVLLLHLVKKRNIYYLLKYKKLVVRGRFMFNVYLGVFERRKNDELQRLYYKPTFAIFLVTKD